MTKYFGEALTEVGKDWGGYILATLVYLAVTALLSIIWIGGFVSGLFLIGYYYFVKRKITEGTAEVGDLFIVFKKTELIIPSLLAGIVITLLTALGLLLLVIPGLIVIGAFLFTYLIILDGEKDFWEAMMKSKDIAATDWLKYIVFALLAGIILTAGALFFGIGMLVTMPIAITAIVLMYEDVKAPKAVNVKEEEVSVIKES
ncbi:MAG: hypothetical protein ABIH00_01575 [Armatimonadota bacterium]